jgi:hypothetical protein
MLPGPVSKAITADGFAAAGIAVRLAMPSYVLQHAAARWVSKKNIIEQGNEGRALSARKHIGGTKIRNDRDSEHGRDDLRFAGLPGAREFSSRIFLGLRLVVERLPVASDQVELERMLLEGGAHGFCIGNAQPPVEACQFSGRRGRCVHGRQHRASQRGRIRKSPMSQQRELRAQFARRDAHHGHIDTIGGCAAHDSGNRH